MEKRDVTALRLAIEQGMVELQESATTLVAYRPPGANFPVKIIGTSARAFQVPTKTRLAGLSNEGQEPAADNLESNDRMSPRGY